MDYKILVNENHEINKNKLQNLILVETINTFGEKILVEKKTYNAYLQLKEFLEGKNIKIGIEKGHLKEDNKNSSEHVTGLALDISIYSEESFQKCDDYLNPKYLNTYEFIHQYLKDYGFILRYPKEKEKITLHKYEPWHIRYVGKRTAAIIDENNLTLEEYYNNYNLNGVLVINKDKNMTSRDVADIVSKTLDISKVGHTGTLDPLATGVLVLTLGSYTKLSECLTSLDKEYIAEVKAGIKTDTLDISGNIIEECSDFSLARLEEVLKSFEKTYYQEVPKYSAVKVNGKKLYEYARQNIEVPLPKKEVTIKSIKLLTKDDTGFTFSCTVSKGTYIRSLIRDIGESLNVLLTMTNLKRTRQGKFKIEESFTLDDLKNGNYHVLTVNDLFDYPKIAVDLVTKNKILNGCKLENTYNIDDKVIFTYEESYLAIYKNEQNILKMWKMLYNI